MKKPPNRPAVERPCVSTDVYEGRLLEAQLCGPDLIGLVDGRELPGFFLFARAAIAAGKKYVDEQIKEEQAKQAIKDSLTRNKGKKK